MQNLTVMIGPVETLGQRYKVYRFYDNAFNPVNGSDPAIPYGLGDSGLTDIWFNPSEAVTTAFSSVTNDLFALKQKEKTISTKHIGIYEQNPIKSTSWKPYTQVISNSAYFKLIEALTISQNGEFEPNMFLITKNIVYILEKQSDGSIKQKEFEVFY